MPYINTIIASITNRYSRQGLWSLFLMCAFPLHLWTLILVFRDMSWVIERTNLWDAIGVASYGMIFALVESIVFFWTVAVLGLLTPGRWDVDRRIAFLSLLVVILSLWGMISQLLFIWNINPPPQTMQFLVQSSHLLRILYAASFLIVLPIVLLPVYWFIKSSKAVTAMQGLMERLSLLAGFYLFFDVIGLIIVIIRNF